MIANITATADVMPPMTSTRIATRCSGATGSPGSAPPGSPSSSTSSLACQKKRYGETVVPKIAMSAAISARLPSSDGIRP